jgi:MarR family transcriptional regulator, lower aerobic nicotinate degradation pathway regulator
VPPAGADFERDGLYTDDMSAAYLADPPSFDRASLAPPSLDPPSLDAPSSPPSAPLLAPLPIALHAMPGHLIRRIHQQTLARYTALTAEFDVTPVQYAVLHAIGGLPDSDQVGIGRAIACDKATVGPVIDRLQAKGLIVRTPDPNDRRVRRLRLTAEGEALLQAIEPAVAQVQRDLLAPLDDGQAHQLMSLLSLLAWPALRTQPTQPSLQPTQPSPSRRRP